VLPLTSHLVDAPQTRIDILPSGQNGLRFHSHVALDRPQTVRREKLGPVIGRMEQGVMTDIARALVVFLGLA
jgi:mRNA interferase MazF